MKKVFLAFTVFAMFLTSCGDDKKKEVKKEVETKVEEVKSDVAVADDQLALGEKLFAEKTCISCHQMDVKVVGPSIKDMATVYKEKNGNFVQFLKGNDAAIVDTDPGQVAIMKTNLDGFVKDMSGDELQALAAYMRNAIK